MWWSELQNSGIAPRFRALVAVLLLGLTLAACGFRPLHSRNEETKYATSDDLAAVLVYPLPDRSGQQMHNLLRDRLNPLGQPSNYRELPWDNGATLRTILETSPVDSQGFQLGGGGQEVSRYPIDIPTLRVAATHSFDHVACIMLLVGAALLLQIQL